MPLFPRNVALSLARLALQPGEFIRSTPRRGVDARRHEDRSWLCKQGDCTFADQPRRWIRCVPPVERCELACLVGRASNSNTGNLMPSAHARKLVHTASRAHIRPSVDLWRGPSRPEPLGAAVPHQISGSPPALSPSRHLPPPHKKDQHPRIPTKGPRC